MLSSWVPSKFGHRIKMWRVTWTGPLATFSLTNINNSSINDLYRLYYDAWWTFSVEIAPDLEKTIWVDEWAMMLPRTQLQPRTVFSRDPILTTRNFIANNAFIMSLNHQFIFTPINELFLFDFCVGVWVGVYPIQSKLRISSLLYLHFPTNPEPIATQGERSDSTSVLLWWDYFDRSTFRFPCSRSGSAWAPSREALPSEKICR